VDVDGWFPRSVSRRFVLGAILALVVGCGPGAYTPPPPPTEEAAIAHLDEVVRLVQSGGVESICSFGSGTCPHELRAMDAAAVPALRPHVVGTRVLAPKRNADGTWAIGGRVISLCGVDGRGEPYSSEMLVFSDGNRLISTNTLYWTGSHVATGDSTGSPLPQAGCR
jgi:hypothetical protein